MNEKNENNVLLNVDNKAFIGGQSRYPPPQDEVEYKLSQVHVDIPLQNSGNVPGAGIRRVHNKILNMQ